MPGRLTGKIALVTGAARGIGLAIARCFAAEGALVWQTDFDPGALSASALPAPHIARLLDVRQEAAWDRIMDELASRHGRIDVLVNNAGISGFEAGPETHDPETASLSAWRRVHETNLDGVFLGCRAALRAMRQTGSGSIINVASRSGQVGIPAAAAYASSKAAIRNHTRTVALYAAEQGWTVRCNCISPAAILTPMWEPMLGEGAERAANMAAFVSDTPLRRFGTVEEVAAAAVLLASDEVPYMTGAELTLDGGILAGSAAAPQRV